MRIRSGQPRLTPIDLSLAAVCGSRTSPLAGCVNSHPDALRAWRCETTAKCRTNSKGGAGFASRRPLRVRGSSGCALAYSSSDLTVLVTSDVADLVLPPIIRLPDAHIHGSVDTR